MSENVNDENVETIEIDPEHPWVEASTIMAPSPLPTSVRVDPVQLPQEDKNAAPIHAAMLTTITPGGVQSVFIPPRALYQLIEQAGEIFNYWNSEKAKKPGLIVADKNMQHAAQSAADAQRNIENIVRGK